MQSLGSTVRTAASTKAVEGTKRSVIQRHGNHVDREVLKQVVTYTGNRKIAKYVHVF